MICRRVVVENFRNIGKAEVEFSEGVNLLYGDNAQGKTNLLEAVCFTALGKSFRRAKEGELIRFGEGQARIVNEFEDSVRRQTLSVTLFAGKTKRIVEQNGVPVGRMSEMVGAFRVVLFCPEHLLLIGGGPELRRAYLNVAISQLRPAYLRALQRYNRVLRQRNSLLRQAREDPSSFRDAEPIWSAQLAEEAAVLSDYRDRYVTAADKHARACFADMAEAGAPREEPSLAYENSLGFSGEGLRDRRAVAEAYRNLLSSRLEREIAAGRTLFGAHKDDIRILLNGRPARLFASQGQARSLALAMKLAEGEISAADSGGDMPTFLLDDVLSELDGRRRAYLLRRLQGRQVILTACDPEAVREGNAGDARMIRVSNGAYLPEGVHEGAAEEGTEEGQGCTCT